MAMQMQQFDNLQSSHQFSGNDVGQVGPDGGMGQRSEVWLPVMSQIVKNREAVPQSLLQQYQRQLVHYNNGYESELGPWSALRSLQVAEQTEIMQQARQRNVAPVAVRMQIVVAPGEYTVPVKQDKRLVPSFKVRVEVEHRGSLYLPVAVSAYPISQEEYDNISQWLPLRDQQERGAAKHITELKGTTRIDHLFDLKVPPVQQQMAAMGSHTGSLMSDPSLKQVYGNMESQGVGMDLAKTMGGPQIRVSSGISGLSNLSGLQEFGLSGLDADMPFLNDLAGMGTLDGKHSDGLKPALNAAMGMGIGGDVGGLAQQPGVHSGNGSLPPTISKVFEFSNLEFNKPSRMRKVYMVFGCSIYDQDYTFCVYQVPTVVYCRKEQVPKACTTLRIPFFDSTTAAAGRDHVDPQHQVGGGFAAAPQALHPGAGGRQQSFAGQSDEAGEMEAQVSYSHHEGTRVVDVHSADQGSDIQGNLLSRGDLHQWILKAYHDRNFTRPLQPADLAALDQQIGFSRDSGSDTIRLSNEQMHEFDGQFKTLLNLLQQLGQMWNQTDPFTVISGLDMDRAKAVAALAPEPVGTFLCRFSWSSFGTLVLTCKVPAGTPNAENMGEYAIMNIQISHEDLQQRRLGTWIRQYHAATQLLDVYRNVRVDKRRVFSQTYTPIRQVNAATVAAVTSMENKASSMPTGSIAQQGNVNPPRTGSGGTAEGDTQMTE